MQTTKHIRRRACGLAILTAGAMAVAVPAASATVVSCGQTITSNTTVSNNLSGCPGDGLDIGASGIVLNLNGHTISGSNDFRGINFDGYNHVTVRNGRVQHFGDGLFVDGPDNVINRITSTANSSDGAELDSADRTNVSQSTMSTNGEEGVRVHNGSDNTAINGVTANGNTYDGLDFYDGGISNAVTQTTAAGNGNDGVNVGNNVGFTLTKSVLNNNGADGFFGIGLDHSVVVDGNGATGNSTGFELLFSSGVQVTHNRAIKNGRGFVDGLAGDLFSSNTAQLNTDTGFTLDHAFNAVLRDNVAGAAVGTSGAGGGNGNGISVINNASGSVVSGNLAHGNKTGDGIYVDNSTSNTTIRNNRTNRNAHDGINEQSGSATLTGNFADFNANFGIEAQPSDTDGGGNEAHGNGVGQCTNVSC